MKTMIAIPCMDTMPSMFVASLTALRRAGDPCLFYFGMNSLIYETRNQIARAAIKEGCDRVLWLDSDMEFEPDIMERLSARIDEGRELVSGLYMTRKDPIRPTIYKEMRITETEKEKKGVAVNYRDYPKNEIFEIEACGFGIVMTTVRLLRDVTEAYGLPFTPVLLYGEDMSFCMRARELGYPLWCDSSIKAGHIGTRIYNEEDHRIYPTDQEEFRIY